MKRTITACLALAIATIAQAGDVSIPSSISSSDAFVLSGNLDTLRYSDNTFITVLPDVSRDAEFPTVTVLAVGYARGNDYGKVNIGLDCIVDMDHPSSDPDFQQRVDIYSYYLNSWVTVSDTQVTFGQRERLTMSPIYSAGFIHPLTCQVKMRVSWVGTDFMSRVRIDQLIWRFSD